MLILQSLICAAALILAALAWARARRSARRLERLAESYWELRYEYGQLRTRLTALEPREDTASAEPPVQAVRGSTAFVPLSSLKR